MKNRFISLSFEIGFIINAFFIWSTFINKTKLKLAKNQAKVKQHPELNFCYLKIVCFLHPHYHPEILGDIIKNVQKITTSA